MGVRKSADSNERKNKEEQEERGSSCCRGKELMLSLLWMRLSEEGEIMKLTMRGLNVVFSGFKIKCTKVFQFGAYVTQQKQNRILYERY